MYKNPVYGFEKSYLENIKNDISKYSENVYFDEFDNLIVSSKSINDETILIGIEASENALLINQISESGLVEFSAYKELDKNIVHQKAIVSNKKGVIFGDEKSYKIDFGYSTKKSVSKFLEKGDTIYIEPTIESLGEAFYTNMKCFLIKNILIDYIKTAKNKNIVFAFIREGKKGAYALGKNLKIKTAYFICLVEEVQVSFIRKEGEYISSKIIEKADISVLKREESLASAYYLAGGSCNATGVALKCQDMKNGIYKVLKSDIDKLFKILDACLDGDV